MTQMPGYPQTYKQLRRSRTDKMIGGVCGGLARYFGIDPVAARVLYVVVAFISGGLALIAYPVLWILMPDEDAPAQPWTPPTAPTTPQPPVA
jgi:phage shock protein C